MNWAPFRPLAKGPYRKTGFVAVQIESARPHSTGRAPAANALCRVEVRPVRVQALSVSVVFLLALDTEPGPRHCLQTSQPNRPVTVKARAVRAVCDAAQRFMRAA